VPPWRSPRFPECPDTDGLARLFHWTGIAAGVAPGYLLPVLCWGLGVLGVLCVLPWWIQAIEGFLPPADPRAALPASLLLGLLTGILATAAVMQDAPLSARGLLTAVFYRIIIRTKLTPAPRIRIASSRLVSLPKKAYPANRGHALTSAAPTQY
jgi:hypothetical protein